MKNIIITGSGGILGTVILEHLKGKKDYKIIAVSSQLERLNDKFKSFKNITIIDSLEKISNFEDAVCINCSFPRSSNGLILAETLDFTISLIEKLNTIKCNTLINISSQSVYSQQGKIIQKETDKVSPESLYGMTKYAIEKIISLKCSQIKMNYVNIRLGSLMSPSFQERMINRFYNMIKEGHIIKVNSGTPKVSYIHVSDAAEALERLINHIFNGKIIANLYNLGNNDWLYIKDIVNKCVEYADESNLISAKIIEIEEESIYNNVIDSSLFYKDINWTPRITMDEMIKEVFLNTKDEFI